MPHDDVDPNPVDLVQTRTATDGDAGALARVELSSALTGYAHIFPESMPKPTSAGLETRWVGFLADPELDVLVATRSGEVIGFVAYGGGSAPGLAEGVLRKLYVMPGQMGRGIGSLLHDRAVQGLRAAGYTTAYLWVLERNIVARGMYARRGWRLLALSKSPWPGTGILELCYRRDLPTRL
jgi:GNAT superfamily N-acetyltransferase